MDSTRQVPKRPPSYVSGSGGTMKTEYLDDGTERVTIYGDCGKMIRTYIQDPCNPKPWWKFWQPDPRHVPPVANQETGPL